MKVKCWKCAGSIKGEVGQTVRCRYCKAFVVIQDGNELKRFLLIGGIALSAIMVVGFLLSILIMFQSRHTEQIENNIAQVKDYQFGDMIEDNNIIFEVVEVKTDIFAGQHYGQFEGIKCTLVHIKVKNTSPGKIVEWKGLQGTGKIEDEYGNIFKPISLSGWAWLPYNLPEKTPDCSMGGFHGDYSTRINPGEIYENAVYFQSIPKTSKKIAVSFLLNNKSVRFHGFEGWKKLL